MKLRIGSTGLLPLVVGALLGFVRPAQADAGACLAEARLVSAEQFLEQVRGAQDYLAAIDAPVIDREVVAAGREVVGRGRGRHGRQRVVRRERQVALFRRISIRAYDECDGTLHTIAVRVPHPLPGQDGPKRPRGAKAGAATFAFTTLTPGYQVTYQGGLGVARLKFAVSRDGRPLTVLAMRHPRIPSSAWRSRDPRLLEDARAAVYSAYQPEFHGRPFTDGLIAAGVRRWLADIAGALGALDESGARSFAFPDERLARLWPPEALLMLGTIEQSDDGAFRDDPRHTAEAVAIEYALNPRPFYFANSSANAIGPYQFTDKGKGSRPGTYTSMVRRCADARLAPSFERGARDLQNSMRAAVCLLDLELARMPEDALRLFREDYRLGATYAVAAYNAGGRQSAKLYDEVPPDALAEAARALDLPLKAFQYRKAVAHRRQRHATRMLVNNETRGYLLKMFVTWDIVDEWMAHAPLSTADAPAAAEPPDATSPPGAEDQPADAPLAEPADTPPAKP